MAGTIALRRRAFIQNASTALVGAAMSPRDGFVAPWARTAMAGCAVVAGRPGNGPIADTGGMSEVDLNADLAEGDGFGPGDLAVLDVVSSASLACGFHAGSPSVMRAAAEACVERGVAIGAHVSYRDRAGFGRRRVDVAADQLAADLVEQWEALAGAVMRAGGRVGYVKPHGALYSAAATDAEVATIVVATLAPLCGVLGGPPGSSLTTVAEHAGVRLVPEGFCDRGYDAGGHLVPRGDDGAMIDDPASAAAQARSLAVDGGVHAVDGTWVALSVRTLCIHGDRPGAGRHGRAVRAALEGASVEIRAFTPPAPALGERVHG